MTGTIFNIQRFCLHDGPGIRTTVFMKGCPLRCLWCHNPEGLSGKKQLQFFADKCIGCGLCRGLCEAHDFSGEHSFDRSLCNLCKKCVDNCPAQAMNICGRDVSVDELVSEILADSSFYSNQGGATFSGGEPLLWADFIFEVATRVKERGYTVAVDTCGYVDWSAFEKVLPVTDVFLFDVKVCSPDVHKFATGVDNAVIKDNLKRLDETGKDIWTRTPVIPGVNASESEMQKIAVLISELKNVKQHTLMPYHSLGKSKYETLGYEYRYDSSLFVSEEEMERYKKIFSDRNIVLK